MKNLSANIYWFSTYSFGSRGIEVVHLHGICYVLMGVWANKAI